MMKACLRTAFLAMTTALGACGTVHGPRGGYLDFLRPDQRPPVVGEIAAADSLWGRPEESSRADGIADHRREDLQTLVDRFTPSLVLPNKDYVELDGKKYRLIPTNVRLVTDTLRLDLIDPAPYALRDSVDIAWRGLGPDSLVALTSRALRYEADPNLLVSWFFDWPGERVSQWWEAYGSYRTGPNRDEWGEPTTYAHPFVDSRGRVIIQYWFFFPFNDYMSNHEGDWEHLNVVLTLDLNRVEEVHYYFHGRSLILPQRGYQPEIVDETHPVIYVGGRMYSVFDYPTRLFGKERNEGSHGMYPFPGEWEGAAGLGHTESVRGPGRDSTRVIRHERFHVTLTPEMSRIDYLRRPAVLEDWGSFILPARWGFPTAASFGSMINADVGNRAPFGPFYNPGWNRIAPGLTYASYRLKKIHPLRSMFEDLLQPWYYLYIFRTPRITHDIRDADERRSLEEAGLVPRGGWREKGFGSPNLGVSLGVPIGEFGGVFNRSTGFFVIRNLWAKLRLGYFDLIGGYQKFSRQEAPGGSLFVYPFTTNFVVRAPDALFRPYGSVGAGVYGWESRIRLTPGSGAQLVESGWNLGWNVAVGIEYYLRTHIAIDISLRRHFTSGPGPSAGIDGSLGFWQLWIGHYVRL